MSYIHKRILLLAVLTVFVIFCYIWFLHVNFTVLENGTIITENFVSISEQTKHTNAIFPKRFRQKFNVDEEQLRRHIHVANMCQILNINETAKHIPKAFFDHLIVDDEHKLIYCYVPKVACTNWKRVLLAISKSNVRNPLSFSGNETHLPNLFKTLNQFSDEEIEKKLNTYLKFMIVRNPYERLLSAYRNKFQYSYSDYFRSRYGTEIIKGYRRKPTKESAKRGHDVTFEEYLRYISNLSTDNRKLLFNEHWRPIVDLCFPCQIKYNIIGKYETLEMDADYVLEKAGLSSVIKFPKRELSYKLKPTSDVMHDYYKNVSKELHKKIAKVYHEDLTLFEYRFTTEAYRSTSSKRNGFSF